MVGVCLDPYALVLEYLPGGSLADLLKNPQEYANISHSGNLLFVFYLLLLLLLF